MNKNDMNGANKAIIFSAFGFIAVVALVIPLSIAYTLFQNNTNFVLGTTGFFQEIVWRVVLTIVALTVLVVCLVKAKNAEHIVAEKGFVKGNFCRAFTNNKCQVSTEAGGYRVLR